MKLVILVAFTVALFAGLLASGDPSYDHQTRTYHSQFIPATFTGDITITPFFSPDHSITELTALVESAKEYLDIGTPGWGSWSGCTQFNTQCVGCTVAFMKANESFPIWQATLNALHRGVQVRILTNDYNTPDCAGEISPLTYLLEAGATIRYYSTTTFMHDKYISVDKKTTSVSSVNFSFTSFMENREAGMILSGTAASGAIKFIGSVFDYDFTHGIVYKAFHTYTSAELAMIHDKTPVPITMPKIRVYKYCNATSPKPYGHTGNTDLTAFPSPDLSFSTVMDGLKSAKKSFYLSIYQITDSDFCNQLITMHKNGIQVYMVVSNQIYSPHDQAAANQCYNTLVSAGIVVRKTHKYCLTYSHEKYWIIDENTVFMSSGNWSPTDFPGPPMTFPPHSESGWRDVNRDMNLKVQKKSVVATFESLFWQDWNQGYDYKPNA